MSKAMSEQKGHAVQATDLKSCILRQCLDDAEIKSLSLTKLESFAALAGYFKLQTNKFQAHQPETNV